MVTQTTEELLDSSFSSRSVSYQRQEECNFEIRKSEVKWKVFFPYSEKDNSKLI
jgi:hypothetical protein